MEETRDGVAQSEAPDLQDVTVTTDQAAKRLGIGTSQVKEFIRLGHFPSTQVNPVDQRNTYKLLLSEVDALIGSTVVLEAQHRRHDPSRKRHTGASGLHKKLTEILLKIIALCKAVTYKDKDNSPEDPVGERGGRPGEHHPRYRNAATCPGVIIRRYSKENGHFFGCTEHDVMTGAGCRYVETISRSKASAELDAAREVAEDLIGELQELKVLDEGHVLV